MPPNTVTTNPFAVMTFIAAPALLTNASCVLALSTTNRMLRTRERMQELFSKSEAGGIGDVEWTQLVRTVDRVESQAGLLLRALRAIYVALGSFSAATLVTLLGAALVPFEGSLWFEALAGLGLILGFVGVGGLAVCSVRLFQSTRLSLINIQAEADLIRERQAERVLRTSASRIDSDRQ